MAQAVTIEFSFDGRRFPSLSGGLGYAAKKFDLNKVGVRKILKAELQNFLNEVAEVMENKHSGAYPAGTGPTSLSKRSGRGVRSIRKSIVVTGTTLDNTQGGIGGLSYLRTHEFGAILRPKNAKYMTIPLAAALDSRGLPKKPRARDWDRTFVNRSKKGNLLIFRRVGRRITPLYLLVGPGERISSIQFREGGSGAGVAPTRLGMRKEIDRRMDKLTDRLAIGILKEIQKG